MLFPSFDRSAPPEKSNQERSTSFEDPGGRQIIEVGHSACLMRTRPSRAISLIMNNPGIRATSRCLPASETAWRRRPPDFPPASLAVNQISPLSGFQARPVASAQPLEMTLCFPLRSTKRIESPAGLDSTKAIRSSLGENLTYRAATIAAVYKERWQIELFFRALTQSLRVKTFVGTSAN